MSTEQPSPEVIREFVIAGHGNLTKVQAMLAAQPVLLNIPYEWSPGDNETAIQGAAHVGNRAVAEYLLTQGAPLELCTAAMLGRRDEVESFLQADSAAIKSNGAHGIPLLCHAALSGDVPLVESLYQRGASMGASLATSLVVSRGDVAMTRWLLENTSPDLTFKNYEDKSMLEIATEASNVEIADLLRNHGATP
jgi:ankyrin repeat protein